MQVDRAGWHHAKDLQVPENMRLIYQPPYSPERESRGACVGTPARKAVPESGLFLPGGGS